MVLTSAEARLRSRLARDEGSRRCRFRSAWRGPVTRDHLRPPADDPRVADWPVSRSVMLLARLQGLVNQELVGGDQSKRSASARRRAMPSSEGFHVRRTLSRDGSAAVEFRRSRKCPLRNARPSSRRVPPDDHVNASLRAQSLPRPRWTSSTSRSSLSVRGRCAKESCCANSTDSTNE